MYMHHTHTYPITTAEDFWGVGESGNKNNGARCCWKFPKFYGFPFF